MKNQSSLTIKDITYIAFCTALLVVCAWIKVPFAIPFTLQCFAVFLIVGLLGGKHAAICTMLYILLGAIGLPVFSGFAGGIGMLFGSTGGYILGFLFPPIAKWIAEALHIKHKYTLALSQCIGLFLCYTFGTLWYLLFYAGGFAGQQLSGILSICVFPFVLPDLLKLVLALYLTKKLRKYIK